MKVLFVHNNFPAQFVHMARALREQGHEVVYVSAYASTTQQVKGLKPLLVKLLSLPKAEEHSDKAQLAYLTALAHANSYANVFTQLRKQGFVPDLIVDHPAWGASQYISDIFPHAARICYMEWYFTKTTQSLFTGCDYEVSPAFFAVLRQRNQILLNALQDADWALTPTRWQCRQLPTNFHYKTQILHDGVDTGFFCPPLTPPSLVLHNAEGEPVADIPAGSELLTYAARGLEPYRGFPQFYAALPQLLEARPQCQVVIMGNDRVHYGESRSDGKGWAAHLRESRPLSEAHARRVHFVPFQPYEVYRRLLQASTVHVYLTVPFVLSWSMLEAMSCGCLLVATDCEPVREVLEHGVNGILSPWGQPDTLAEVISHTLEHAENLRGMRRAARETVLQYYDLDMLLPQQLSVLQDVLRRKPR